MWCDFKRPIVLVGGWYREGKAIASAVSINHLDVQRSAVVKHSTSYQPAATLASTRKAMQKVCTWPLNLGAVCKRDQGMDPADPFTRAIVPIDRWAPG